MPVKLTEDQINEYIDAFDSMDYDADGYLTKEEICKVTQSLDLCHRTDKLMDIISSLNYNSNRISKMEFLTLVKSLTDQRTKPLGRQNSIHMSAQQLASKVTGWFQGEGEDGLSASFFARSLHGARTVATAESSKQNTRQSVEPISNVIVDISDSKKGEDSDYEYYSYSEDEDHDEQKKPLMMMESETPVAPIGPTAPPLEPSSSAYAKNNISEYQNNMVAMQQMPMPMPIPLAPPAYTPSPMVGYMQPVPMQPDQPRWQQNNYPRPPSSRHYRHHRDGYTRSENRRKSSGVASDRHGRGLKPSTADTDLKLQGTGMAALRDPRIRRRLSRMSESKPIFTMMVTLVQVVVFLYEIYANNGVESFSTNPFGGPSRLVLIQLGAKYVPCMRPDKDVKGDFYTACDTKYPNNMPRAKDGRCLYYDNLAFICGMGGFTIREKPDQIWRFFTPIFLHNGFIHIAFNMLMQFKIGWGMERMIGSTRFGIIYFLCGTGGNLFAAILAPNQPSAGSSGALYGLFALLYLDLYQNWPLLTSPYFDLLKLTFNVALALAIGLLPYVDNYAHIGGFVTGIFAGVVFMPTIAFTRETRRRKRLIAILVAPVLLTGFALGFYVFWLGLSNVCPWCVYLDCIPPGQGWCLDQR